MCLLLVSSGMAALFVLLDAYLLAFLLVLVYAGAVVALFLFIIMLLDVQGGDPRRPYHRLAAVSGVRRRRRCWRSACSRSAAMAGSRARTPAAGARRRRQL